MSSLIMRRTVFHGDAGIPVWFHILLIKGTHQAWATLMRGAHVCPQGEPPVLNTKANIKHSNSRVDTQNLRIPDST